MNKSDKLQIRIDSNLKKAFKDHCEKKGSKMSQVLENLIKKELLERTSK